MSKNISQIIAELFARPMESKELSTQIQRLGDEIRKVIRSEDTMFGKFGGLLASFQAIIPDERQRYQAVLQALSTTSKLSRQEVMQAINSQLVELKIAENGLLPTQQSWREVLKGMESRSQQLKGELAQLRGRLAQLESEERAIQSAMMAQEKELALAEQAMKELFTSIGAEMSALTKKIQESTTEAPVAQQTPPVIELAMPAPQPAPPVAQPASPAVQTAPPAVPPAAAQPVAQTVPVTNEVSGKKKEAEQKVEIQSAAPQQDTKFQRKCPMCGGPFNLLEFENIWQCYTCAYEEPNK